MMVHINIHIHVQPVLFSIHVMYVKTAHLSFQNIGDNDIKFSKYNRHYGEGKNSSPALFYTDTDLGLHDLYIVLLFQTLFQFRLCWRDYVDLLRS